MSETRRAAIESDERILGRRRDSSRTSARRTLKRGSAIARELEVVRIATDEKSSYPGLLREAFGEGRVEQTCTNSKLARQTWNPLFPINHTEAMLRDLTGRVRRESWLVSKKRRYLDLGLALWGCWRNYVRRRFNHDTESPAQRLGFADRRLSEDTLLSWRQDWGRESVHPLSWQSRSVEEWAQRRQAS